MTHKSSFPKEEFLEMLEKMLKPQPTTVQQAMDEAAKRRIPKIPKIKQ